MAVRQDDEFLARCREEYEADYERDKIDREEAQDDNKFANASDKEKGQWDPTKKKAREAAFRPVLQWNRIPTYVQHVANAGRQNKPGVKISAGDNGVDHTAQFLESRIRQIEYESKADIAYDTARDQQITSGRAALRVTTEYIPGTFKQRQVVKRIENQFSVIWGPAREYDCSDAERVWVITLITKAEHRRKYGKDSVLNRTDFANKPELALWINVGERHDMVQIAEKFEKLPATQTIKDPETGEEREEETWIVKRYVINGTEILEEGEAISDDFDIVPMWGREAVVDGVQRRYSLINQAKDPQRLTNLYVSNIAENIAKQPKNKYKVPVGAIPEHLLQDWADDAPNGVAQYNGYDENGRPYAVPQAETNEPPIEALSVGLQQSIEGIKAAMGIYDASMGQRSNETSGVAINRRKVEGEVTNFHFSDNESRTLVRVRQIILKRISKLDKTGTKVPVRHENGKTEMVPIGVPYRHPKTGKEITHILTDADYGVHVEEGPNYANAKEQAEEAQQGLITAAPELLMSEVGVNWIRNSGRPGADADADALERLIKFKFPGLIPDTPEEGGTPIPPEAQQKIAQLTQQNQKLDAFAQSLHQQIESKQPEIDSRERIAVKQEDVRLQMVKLQEETKKEIALAKLNSDEALARLEHDLNIIHSKTDRTHELLTQVLGQRHEADQATQSQAVQSTEADKSRQAASDEAERARQAQAEKMEMAGAEK